MLRAETVAKLRQDSETIGERILRLRTEGGFSQRAISGPGVSAAYICRIEKGERTPSVKALRVIAQKLGVTAEYLETGIELPDVEARDLRLSEAELELRLAEDLAGAEKRFRALHKEAQQTGDEAAAIRAQIGLGLAADALGKHG
jgi:transcriptional regulator with XRE-family HTH domain